MRASRDCRTRILWIADEAHMLDRVRAAGRACTRSNRFPIAGIAASTSARVAMARRRAVDGRRAQRGRDVHAQSDDRRPLGDHDRRRVGPGIGGGRRRGHARPLGRRQDHRRDQRARDLRQTHRASPRGGGRHRERGGRAGTPRRAPCLSDAELEQLRQVGAPHREALRLRAGHRVGDRRARRVAAAAEPARDRVVVEGGRARGARRGRSACRTSCRSSEDGGESDGEGHRGDHAAARGLELRRARSRESTA